MNEIENIMYDNYTDPNQINYTYKDNKNFNQKYFRYATRIN